MTTYRSEVELSIFSAKLTKLLKFWMKMEYPTKLVMK